MSDGAPQGRDRGPRLPPQRKFHVTGVTDFLPLLEDTHAKETLMPAGRNALLWATVLCALGFLVMTVDTLRQMPARTHADQLSPEVVRGKRLWQHYDCNDCHTILGIGGYYAPDVTKSYAIRGDAWLAKFLKDPQAMYAGQRQMPNFHLTDEQTASLVAFLKWTSQVDTNGWPPSPIGAGAHEPEGHRLFLASGCSTCHAIEGSGGTIGPELTHVGGRRTKEWILDQVNNPRGHKADGLMPSFSQLADNDKQQLAEYLAGLK
jgi:nitric oxide reductase subunit C